MNFAVNIDEQISNVNFSEHAPPGSRARILLIEDDQEIADEVANDLLDRAYDVTHAATGSKGAEEARRGSHDLLIVDLLLPETDGLSCSFTIIPTPCRSISSRRVSAAALASPSAAGLVKTVARLR
jgi:CheY-like chemotaxis protein